MKYSALILAAGKHAGEGKSYTKAFAQFDSDKSVLERSVSIFLEDDQCKQIVIVTNSADMRRIVGVHDSGKIIHVKGRQTRCESVMAGLTAVSEDVVLIHDGVRPWVQHELIARILENMETEKACVLATEIKGAFIRTGDGYLTEIVKTKGMMQTQTPQAYRTSFILKCYSEAQRLGLNVLDDAELVSRVSDERIAVIEGDRRNVRFITKELD